MYTINDPIIQNCPIRNVLSRISDKWSLLVIYTLHSAKTMRFSMLRKQIPDISQKMLTSTLRTLECDGYITRKVYAEVPPRVEYQLTERSRTLLPHIDSLIDWAQEHATEILNDRAEHTI